MIAVPTRAALVYIMKPINMRFVKINSAYLQLYYGAEGSELTIAQWIAVKQISIYWAFVGNELENKLSLIDKLLVV